MISQSDIITLEELQQMRAAEAEKAALQLELLRLRVQRERARGKAHALRSTARRRSSRTVLMPAVCITFFVGLIFLGYLVVYVMAHLLPIK